MALKPIINAFEFTSLATVLQSEYKLGADGAYKLDLIGGFVTDKDPVGLLNALNAEREENKNTKAKFDAIVQERDAAKKAAELAELQKTGKAEELQKYFEKQNKDLQDSFAAQLKVTNDRLEQQKIAQAETYRKAQAMALATELFGQKAPIFAPALLQQIKVTPSDFGVEPTLEFTNELGQPLLGATKESFKQGLLTNPLYKDIIVASSASGGSANEGKANVPASRNADGSARTFKDYTPGELMRLKKTSPGEFQAVLATANQSQG